MLLEIVQVYWWEKCTKFVISFWLIFLTEVKVPMTAPVTIESKPDNQSVMKRCFTMGFYIPEAFQSNPPAPTEDGVFIETRPAMKVYCWWDIYT